MNNHHSQPSGYVALITIIIIGAIVSTIAAYLLLSGTGANKFGQGGERAAYAQSAAQSCLDLSLAAIQANTTLTTPASGNFTLSASTKQTCSYTITGTTPTYTIVATGVVDSSQGNVTRRLTTSTYQVNPFVGINAINATP